MSQIVATLLLTHTPFTVTVLCILTIFRGQEDLIPDAPELIAAFLDVEQDASCKRNAFVMLIAVDQVGPCTELPL